MSYRFNPFTGELDDIGTLGYLGVLSSAPSNPENGWAYINSTNGNYYVFYHGVWNLVFSSLGAYLLLETGDILLNETSDKMLQEI